jgi:hypothetical protein
MMREESSLRVSIILFGLSVKENVKVNFLKNLLGKKSPFLR